MNIFLRVDSSLSIGTGHIVRSLNLANALRNTGAECHFITKQHTGHIIPKIESQDFNVSIIPGAPESEGYIVDEKSWLNGTQAQDACEFIALGEQAAVNPEVIIVDHYSLDYEWEYAIKKQYPSARIVVIDDLCNRQHWADMIIDQTFKRTPEEYGALNKANGQIYSGTSYALINPAFVALSAKSIKRKKALQEPKSVLITMGGVDAQNVTETILTWLNENETTFFDKITIVMGRASPHQSAVREAAKHARFPVEVLIDVDTMPELMLEHDLAIGALGGTTWERCVMGLPAVNIAIADNQMTIAESLRSSGAIVLYADSLQSQTFMLALIDLITRYKEHMLLAMNICDGHGMSRVVQNILSQPAREGKNVILRPATERDIDFVYKLQCEPQTREFARNPEIPAYDDHVAWMKRKLNDERVKFYIIECEIACGVLRLDPIEHSGADFEISIFMTEKSQGKGIASAAIKRAMMLNNDVKMLATVLAANTASHLLFQRLGFTKISNSEYLSE